MMTARAILNQGEETSLEFEGTGQNDNCLKGPDQQPPTQTPAAPKPDESKRPKDYHAFTEWCAAVKEACKTGALQPEDHDRLTRDAQELNLTDGVVKWQIEFALRRARGEADPPADWLPTAAPSRDMAGISLHDFYAYMPQHTYIFAPSRDMWPAVSVNARIAPVGGQKASEWLDANQPVEQMTWAPGMPMLIRGQLIADGGWFKREGLTCFNLYRPAIIKPGNAEEAISWVQLVWKVYPNDADHILDWLAHRVQKPAEKINHALLLGGAPGIGKDTMLEPAKHAVGPWNCMEVSPKQLLGRFNSFLKSVILRVSEARDLGDFDRFQLYDHMKTIIAAPPDVLRVDEKNLREYSIPNCTGVVITTNRKADGIYLPSDDRRHYVAWSDLTMDNFEPGYWDRLWAWYLNGGFGHVAVYLMQRDISGFNPKAPPLKTQAFWAIVDAGNLSYVAVSRSTFVVTIDQETGQHLFAMAKGNLGPSDTPALAYDIDTRVVGTDAQLGVPIVAPYVVWRGQLDMTANQAVVAEAGKLQQQDGKGGAAQNLLRELLASGPMPMREIERVAAERQISWRTVQAMKKLTGVISEKPVGVHHAGWIWRLPCRLR
jgi:hypothetical protein